MAQDEDQTGEEQLISWPWGWSTSVEMKRVEDLKREWSLANPVEVAMARSRLDKDMADIARRVGDPCTCCVMELHEVKPPKPQQRVRFVPHGHPFRAAFVLEGRVKREVGRGWDIITRGRLRERIYYAHVRDILGVYEGEQYSQFRVLDDHPLSGIDFGVI